MSSHRFTTPFVSLKSQFISDLKVPQQFSSNKSLALNSFIPGTQVRTILVSNQVVNYSVVYTDNCHIIIVVNCCLPWVTIFLVPISHEKLTAITNLLGVNFLCLPYRSCEPIWNCCFQNLTSLLPSYLPFKLICLSAKCCTRIMGLFLTGLNSLNNF